jgi:ribosome maturation factor RimP
MGFEPIFCFWNQEMQNLQTLLEQALTQIGYELVDLEMSNHGKLLRLFIDKPGGITIDDCALVSEHISHFLAVENDIDYDRLEISSPGMDRVLKKENDFDRFAGSKVQIKLRVPVNGQKKFVGVLRGIEQGIVRVELETGEQDFALSNIDKARLSPEF